MNTLWVFGCSYSADWYLEDKNNFYNQYKDYRGGNLPEVWGKILSNKLGYNYINLAIGGSSNYNIFQQYITNLDNIKKNDIVIIGWTSVLRFRVVISTLNKFYDVLPNNKVEIPFISQTTLDEILFNRENICWIDEILNWIKIINFCSKKIESKIYHWTSCPISGKYIYLKENQNENNIIKLPTGYIDLINYISDILKDENNKNIARIFEETNNQIQDGHFGEYGHKCQAEFFYNYIINNFQKN